MKQMDSLHETDFTRDFTTIRELADVPAYQSYVFVMKNFPSNLPIDVLELSVRAENSLKRGDIKTFGQLLECELRKLRSCGANTIKEINTKLVSYVYDTYNDSQRKQFWRDTYEATKDLYNPKGGDG